MKKTTAMTAGTIWLLFLLVLLTPQLMGIRTAKAWDSSIMYGTTCLMTVWEKEASAYTCQYIYDRFAETGHYYLLRNYYGPQTQQDTVYYYTWGCDRYSSFATVFYKGHTFFYDNGHRHYFIYDNEGGGEDNRILDDHVHDVMTYGRHDFVFLWSCFVGDEIGGFSGTESWGMPASWLLTTDLSLDGYLRPDNSDHCFIGFQNVSMPFVQETGYSYYNYGDFCRKFYHSALRYSGYTIRMALSYASYATIGRSYTQSLLYQGYWWYEQGVYWYSRMEVYGDGNFEVPD